MPRAFSTAFRNDLEAPSSGHPRAPILATLRHAAMPVTRYLASDNVDYLLGGNRYLGVALGVVLVSDNDGTPRGRLRMSNIDGEVGRIVALMRDSPWVKLEVYHAGDFAEYDAGQNARVAIGTPVPQETEDWLMLANVVADDIAVEAELVGWDLTAWSYPAVRATRERLPALFRKVV